jgi:hypothetical protein
MVKVTFARFANAVNGGSYKTFVKKRPRGRAAVGKVDNFHIRPDKSGWQTLGYQMTSLNTTGGSKISRLGQDAEFFINLNSFTIRTSYVRILLYKQNYNTIGTLWRRI